MSFLKSKSGHFYQRRVYHLSPTGQDLAPDSPRNFTRNISALGWLSKRAATAGCYWCIATAGQLAPPLPRYFVKVKQLVSNQRAKRNLNRQMSILLY